MAKEELFNILRQGAKVWNKWREENPDVQLDFRGANLTRKTFNDVHARAATIGIRLPTGPFPLIEANLSKVDLRGANLRGADLTETNLRGADLTGAKLCYAHLVGTKLENATLTGCHIFGISTWDLKLEGTVQSNLIITPPGEPTITVDYLEVAQFIYLLLDNEKIRDVIETITTKVVLILGRFTSERKGILNAIREELRRHDYLPVVFDFETPACRDTQETITTLARLARFVIADITDPRSVPQELVSIVESLPSLPIQPLLEVGYEPWGMYDHIKRYPWVLEIHHYKDLDGLLTSLSEKVITPAEIMLLQFGRKMN